MINIANLNANLILVRVARKSQLPTEVILTAFLKMRVCLRCVCSLFVESIFKSRSLFNLSTKKFCLKEKAKILAQNW